MRSKRPWKRYIAINKCERNNGDVYYATTARELVAHGVDKHFQSLAEAEAHADAWWAEWFPQQVKHTRRA